ncbi:MAG: bifunctional diaminohydroxyphosphoribosylaminopyrimidine deaminase/5-amino-6-(5-phosphoribosylamino)uracil reductase RibD [Phycisphaerae bacterium]|nr:bifunctional diaminohydroxyphosphoribosylaminopyrimidine deaminase/5-amino-6-(5-phosphoribosylamino)uracil reductase RibD [Phycisphaerae bacterium]
MAKTDAELDRRMMARALRLARRGQGRVEPNPMVGCVLVRAGRIVGEGWHRRFGGPHAEVEALRRAGRRARGATAYVTLEPCCHHGKTPPCTDALLHAGVSRVVAAMVDPNPLVRGRGIRRLRNAGVRVDVGLLEDEARSLNRPFCTRIETGLPYVILKWAQSLDGRIATRTGQSKWISCEASRRRVHQLRARMDAVLIGSGTALADDPMLTARDVPVRRVATRVVLDSRLRLPVSSKLVQTAGQFPTLVFTSRKALTAHGRTATCLKSHGVELIACPTGRTGIDLRCALRALARRGATNVLVEGGSQILGSFWDAGLANETYVFVAPILLGGATAVPALGGTGTSQVSNAALSSHKIMRCGSDLLYHSIL